MWKDILLFGGKVFQGVGSLLGMFSETMLPNLQKNGPLNLQLGWD